MLKGMWVPVVAAAFLLLSSAPADAQVRLGAQASVGSDSGLGLGGRLVFPLRFGPFGLDGAFDANYFFGGGDAIDSWIDANANARIPLPISPAFRTRVGAGVNATFVSFEAGAPSTDTDTEFGLNLLASLELPRGNLMPFLELRAVLGGAEQVVLTGGFTVGGAR